MSEAIKSESNQQSPVAAIPAQLKDYKNTE